MGVMTGIVAEVYGEGNHAPIITSTDTFYVPQTGEYVGRVTAIDPDNDQITFTIVGGPDADLFHIDPDTGELEFSTGLVIPPPFATVDLLTGTYVIDGVTYTLDALTRDPAEEFWSGPVYAHLDQLVPGRGLLITEANQNGPAADSVLYTKLSQPHTGMIEWEDFAFDGTDFPVWIYNEGGEAISGFEYVHRMYCAAQFVGFEAALDDGVPDVSVYSTDDTYNWAGVNRIAWTVGTNDTNVSRNGDDVNPTSVDTTGIFNPIPSKWITPWGGVLGNANLTGIPARTWRLSFDENGYVRTGNKIRLRFEAHGTTPLVITSCYMGVQGTEEFDMVSPTPITFGGGNPGITIPAGTTGLSDEITFAFDGSVDYVVSFHTTSTSLRSANRNDVTSYYKDSVDEAATPDVTGYIFSSGSDPCIVQIDLQIQPALVDISIFGSWRSSMGWIMMGFARKILLYAPQPKEMLPILSGIGDLPGSIITGGQLDEIEQVSETATTITVGWDTDAPRATSYEYWIDPGINSTPYEDNYAWLPLPLDKTITGLTIQSDYSIGVRGVNAAGYGPLAFTNANTLYPANGLSLNGKLLVLNTKTLTLN